MLPWLTLIFSSSPSPQEQRVLRSIQKGLPFALEAGLLQADGT